MKVHIVARGKIGHGPEAELIARYRQRLHWPFHITELPDYGGRVPPLIGRTVIVALDERGESPTSLAFAGRLGAWRDQGVRECRFLIGAADGLTAEERASADWMMSLGAATWPHLLVRAMLTEQIWRAVSILSGHPYHRSG